MPKNLVRPTSKGQVTIPKSIRNKLNIDSETFLDVSVENNKIIFQPLSMKKISENTRIYSDEEIDEFLAEDKLSAEDAVFFKKFLSKKR